MSPRKFIQLNSLRAKNLKEQVESLKQELENAELEYDWMADHEPVHRNPLEIIQERINTYRSQPVIEVLCEVMRENGYDLQPAALAECGGGSMRSEKKEKLRNDLKKLLAELSELMSHHDITTGALLIEKENTVAFFPFANNAKDLVGIINTCKHDMPEKADQALKAFGFIVNEVESDRQATRH